MNTDANLAPAGHDAGDCADHCPLAAVVSRGVDRRTFISRAVLATAAAALAACAGGADAGITGPTTVSTSTLRLSDYPALASVNGVALVTVSGVPLAVVRTGSTSFVALSRICPHEGTVINSSGNGFTCPRHGARFSITGTWQGGQRTSSLRSYATSYDAAAGTLTIG